MRRLSLLVLLLFPAALLAQSKPATTAPTPPPRIAQNGTVKQMFVDGKPFIMLAGELHNSSASSVEYMKPIWDHLAKLNLNTVLGTVSWELLEPEEGKFDFSLVDAQIQEARKRNMRLGFIWFGAWKVASSPAPVWVKKDPARFPLLVTRPAAGGRGGGRGRERPLQRLAERVRRAERGGRRASLRGAYARTFARSTRSTPSF